MASLTKLQIRGVRAFSPDGQAQVLRFQKPMTVIVGANGCGKTTIIECLKYAVTGTVPPNSAHGQTFVHDPALCDQSEVQAQIRLQFQNRGGVPVAITRSMRLTQGRGKKLKFQAHDVNMQTTFKGEAHSLSHKCSEMDTLVPQLLGANKAVLNDVVFCHQEDSLWPLSDNKVVKTKFDAIFESTRYSLALAELKKQSKDLNQKLKESKLELINLETYQKRAAVLEREIDEGQAWLDEESERIDASVEKAAEIREEIKDLVEEEEATKEAAQVVVDAVQARVRAESEFIKAQEQVSVFIYRYILNEFC